jgi:Big-like domain-containing protein
MRGILTGGLILTLAALGFGCSDSPTDPGDPGGTLQPIPAGPVEFTIVASPTTINAGRSVYLKASAGRPGEQAAIPSADVRWESADTTVATVSKMGQVRGQRSGQVDVRGYWHTDKATVRITVVPSVEDPSCRKDLCL